MDGRLRLTWFSLVVVGRPISITMNVRFRLFNPGLRSLIGIIILEVLAAMVTFRYLKMYSKSYDFTHMTFTNCRLEIELITKQIARGNGYQSSGPLHRYSFILANAVPKDSTFSTDHKIFICTAVTMTA